MKLALLAASWGLSGVLALGFAVQVYRHDVAADSLECLRKGSCITGSLESYKGRHGGYPASLDDVPNCYDSPLGDVYYSKGEGDSYYLAVPGRHGRWVYVRAFNCWDGWESNRLLD